MQLGNLTKLAKEEQWHFWLEDLRGIMFLNGLQNYFNSTAVEGDSDVQKGEFAMKHETVRTIIHSALSMNIRERMRHHGYNPEIHRGQEIIDFALKSVKLITGNMDKLYYSMWKDLRRTDFKSWTDFTAEFRRLYGKLKETGQEVTAKLASIHLFDKIRMYIPIWVEINEARFLLEPDLDRLLLELETRGRQLEYDGVSLASLRANGDRNPGELVSDSKPKGAVRGNDKTGEKIDQNMGQPQGQSQGQRQKPEARNHHFDRDNNNQKLNTPRTESRFCEPCNKWHRGDCWPYCADCEFRHSTRFVCRKNRVPGERVELQGSSTGAGNVPRKMTDNPATASGSIQATENVFNYGMLSAALTEPGLTRDSWIYDTGASFHTCNDWKLMENVVKGEPRTTTAANGQQQTGNLFGSVRICVRCGDGKRIITLLDVMYIPEAPCNLISEVRFFRGKLYLDAQRSMIHDGTAIVANCPAVDSSSVRVLEIHPDNESITRKIAPLFLAAKSSETLYEIWHQRLMHVGDETLVRTLKTMNIEIEKPPNWSCKSCKLAKAYKQISRDTPMRSQEACAELHTDTIPLKPQGIGGFNYAMTIIDAATMYTWVVYLPQKSDAGSRLHEFIRWLEKQSGKSVKTIVRDGGKEYLPNAAIEFAKEKGIVIRESAPRTPEQNGKAEVFGRHIIEMARVARINAGLPESLWPWAIRHTVDVRNLTPKKQLGWKSPHEVFGRALNLPEKSVQPYMEHLRIFGCEAFVRIPEEDPDFVKARKTKERARIGMFVGTEGLRGHIYVVWVPSKNRLIRSRDVQFREEIKHLSQDSVSEIKEIEEESTYRATIPRVANEHVQAAPKPDGRDPERSATPAAQRYGTPDSMDEATAPDNDSDTEEWYPADIQQDNFEDQDDANREPVENRTALREQEDESSGQATEQKTEKGQSRKGKERQEPTRSSTRTNKGQRNDAFAKEHYITYVNFVAAQVAKQFVPQSFKAAIESSNRDMWLAACRKQLAKIEKKRSWELCHLPKGHKVLPTKWVFDPKLRARLVVCGNFEKKTDIETFAAVVNMTMVKIFFLVVAAQNWECRQYDFEAAFLNGEMNTRAAYVRQPPGFEDGTNRVYKLLKTLYGLRDAPLAWFRQVTELMRKEGFTPLSSEACVFVSKDLKVWIILYVDDMAIAAATKEQIEHVANQLSKTFELTPLGDVDHFLGLQIVRDRNRRTISLTQEPYVERVLTGRNWTNLKGAATPLDPRMRYDTELPELSEEERTDFLELVGSAQWIGNNTRPDIAYAANFLGRHRVKPTSQHMAQAKRMWRYICGTKKLGLTLGGCSIDELELWLHCDASWADDPQTRKTTAGHIIYVGDSPIKWLSKQQSLITLSTTEAEYVNMSTAGRDMMWVKKLLCDMKIPMTKVPMIGTDSRNALLAAESDRVSLSTRHTDVRYKWVKERIRNGELTLKWIDTAQMKADGLTKPLAADKQAHFVRLIGLTEIIGWRTENKKNEEIDTGKLTGNENENRATNYSPN